MASCPKCHGEGFVKDGIVNGRQRYRCKGCGYRHTVAERGAGAAVRRQALQLYLEGMGFRAIGRFLGVSHVAVYYWVKSFGNAVESVCNMATEVKVVEMDELHSHVRYKKTTAGSTPQGTRAETYAAEGYNSLLRHSLARLKRKTKCYSKSQDMLECSVKLFMAYWNNGKSICI